MSQRGQAEINKDFTSSNPLWKSTPGKRNKGRRFQHNNSSQTPNKKRHYAQHQTRNPTRFKQTTTTTTPGNSIQQLGFFGSVPSLQDLHRENRKRARRHYKHHHTSKYSNQPYLEYHNAGMYSTLQKLSTIDLYHFKQRLPSFQAANIKPRKYLLHRHQIGLF